MVVNVNASKATDCFRFDGNDHHHATRIVIQVKLLLRLLEIPIPTTSVMQMRAELAYSRMAQSNTKTISITIRNAMQKHMRANNCVQTIAQAQMIVFSLLSINDAISLSSRSRLFISKILEPRKSLQIIET